MKRKIHAVRANRHTNLQENVTTFNETHLLKFVDTLKEPFLLVLDCVQDPHNLGACLRSADAVGVHAVITPRRRSAPITETVRKVACGAAEKILFAQVTNLARTLRNLQIAGLRIVGTNHTAQKSIFEEDLTGPLALVMGAEASGLRHLTSEICDALVSIPMFGSVSCLNVSVATGVCLFEAKRQRLDLDHRSLTTL